MNVFTERFRLYDETVGETGRHSRLRRLLRQQMQRVNAQLEHKHVSPREYSDAVNTSRQRNIRI